MRPLSLNVSGLNINIIPRGDVCTEDSRMYFLLRGFFGSFLRDDISPKSDLDLEIHAIDKSVFQREYRAKDCLRKQNRFYITKDALLEFDSGKKRAFMYVVKEGEGVMGFFVSIQPILLFTVSLLGMRHSYIILHAAGMAFAQKGYIFFGRSGAGKTTLCSLLGNKNIYSDDVVFVKEIRGDFYLQSSPFRQFSLDQAPYPGSEIIKINSLFMLKKSDKHNIELMNIRKALVKILKEGVYFYEYMSPVNRKYIFNFCFRMLKKIPSYRLFFKRDKNIYKILKREVLNEEKKAV